MFKEYDLNVQQLKTTCLQLGLLSFENLEKDDDDEVDDDVLAKITNEPLCLTQLSQWQLKKSLQNYFI